MRRIAFLLGIAVAVAAQTPEISGSRIRTHTKFLADDLLEGRGVGARGGKLTTAYLAGQFALIGAKPAGDSGTYFQKVPLVGVETLPGARLAAVSKGKTLPLRWLDDFVGGSERQTTLDHFDAEAVFVGHGIVAPEFGWDDFKGVDVKGKILVLFTNEPPSEDKNFFGGKSLTYYGRWTYKYEQAVRMGALGVIILHTPATAGYGWNVVRNSWAREEPYVKLKPGEPALALAGWVSQEAAQKLATIAGKTLVELEKQSNSRDFRPFSLKFRFRGRIPSKVRELDTENVVALIEGSDPARKPEAVVFSAHWDHLGIGMPVKGDRIYNGAVDNATGCAMLLEVARAWAALEPKPRRSALFIATTAEEGGLRGSEYYAANPIVPPGKIAVGLNFDAYLPLGRTKDVVLNGVNRTTFWPVAQDVAARMGLKIVPDSGNGQGAFYRSDHFPLAKAGVPAFSVNMGSEFYGKLEGFAASFEQKYGANSYHQPSDEYNEQWDFSGLEFVARFGFALGMEAANMDALPTWNAEDEFRTVREQSLKAR